MLTYSFTNIGSDPLYIHLYKCIKNDIISGVLTTDMKLPSKRSFAKNLGISTITVENAYAQLQSEGYIYSLPKKGFYVSAIEPVSAQALPVSAPEQETPLSQDRKTGAAVDLVSNRTSIDSFPFSVWAKIIRETISEKRQELMTAPPSGGIMALRRAICEHLKAYRNMDIAPEQIIIGAGTEYLYGLLIQLLGFDKSYAIENPGYRKLLQVYQSHHVTCCPIPVDHEGIDVLSLNQSGADVAHITPSHHFPTGIITSISRRYELLGWAARENGRYIIEDDYDSEFRLTGKPIPPLQSIDHSEKVIYINTFSKSLSSTVRLGYMVLPPQLLERYRQKLHFCSCTVSNFEQYTLAHFLSEGHFEKHINRMRTHYKTVRDELLLAIKKSPFASRIHILEEDAGLHFLMEIDTSLSDHELIERAQKNSIHLACLSEYYFGEEQSRPDHTIVVNYSGLTREQIPEVAKRLQCFFADSI
ncbi:MAG: PLP-dependent aminotransferase family protein [Clostridiaceae bacterium]|nr:PLP-dependent aminotransferase family protein [Clostridiaceae bacterium]